MKKPYLAQNIKVGDIQILADLQSVQTVSGNQFPIPRREFQLLKLLAHHFDSVVSRFAILDLIWEINSFSGSNTLEVHLSSLRKKLQKISEQLKIQTIKGVGYRLTSAPLL